MKVNWKTRVVGAVASLAACAMPLAMGVPTAMADTWGNWEYVRISNVRVENVQAREASITFDYELNPNKIKDMGKICVYASVYNLVNITPHSLNLGAIAAPYNYYTQKLCYAGTGTVHDSGMTAEQYQDIYGVKKSVYKNNGETTSEADIQSYYRSSDKTQD